MTEARKETDPSTSSPDSGDDWVTLPQAARELGKHRQTVLGLGSAGELVIEWRAAYAFVSRASIAAYQARQRDAAVAV